MTRTKPEWLKVNIPVGANINFVENLLLESGINTVCKAAKCPNRLECYNSKTATFLILGSICTRSCNFCNIEKGIPESINNSEADKITEIVNKLNLKYVVITSVTRDDLPDGGAEQFYKVCSTLKKIDRKVDIEILIPDFMGDENSLNRVIEGNPKVINHNIESIPRLYNQVRPGANYIRSLNILKYIKSRSSILTKSGIMLGLGESMDEVKDVLKDLRSVHCDLLTIGQYCQPTIKHLPVSDYITPELFAELEEYALSIGFKGVASGPLVRSSYNAAKLLKGV